MTHRGRIYQRGDIYYVAYRWDGRERFFAQSQRARITSSLRRRVYRFEAGASHLAMDFGSRRLGHPSATCTDYFILTPQGLPIRGRRFPFGNG